MSELVRARIEDHLVRLRMRHVAQRIDAMLSEAARGEPTYLDFLDGLLREEVDSKQRKRVQMGLTIAHFPQARTLEDFDFRFQPSVDQRLVKELSTGRFIALSDNVLASLLPERERKLLSLIRRGYSLPEASRLLGIPAGSRDYYHGRLVACARRELKCRAVPMPGKPGHQSRRRVNM